MAIATLTIDLVAKIANIERDLGRAAQITERNAKRMDDAFRGVEGALKAVGGILTVDMFVGWVKGATDAAAEIGKFAQLSGAGTDEFQRYAAGAKTVGFESAKLADVFKDVNDKVGDFLTTGGGPLKDFFETVAPQVGITADAFRNLSGPQALQLYFNSLQKAGVSQERLTFFMEAIANDATALAPLLRDNGAEFNRIANEAERLGLILDGDLIRASKEFNENLDRLAGLSRSVAAEIGNVVIPVLNRLAEEFLDARRAGLSFLEALSSLGTADPSKTAEQQVERVQREIADLRKELEKPLLFQSPFTALSGRERLEQLQKELEYWKIQAQRQFDRNFVGPQQFTLPTGGGGGGRTPITPRGGRTGGSELDPLADAARAYQTALESLTRAQRDADTAGFDLSQTEQGLLRIMSSPEWMRMPETWRTTVLAQGEATISAEHFAEQQQRLKSLLVDSGLERQREDMQLLADEFLRGGINADQYAEAVNRALGNVSPAVAEVKDEFASLQQAIEGWGKQSADAIVQFAITGEKSFGDMIDSMLADLARMLVYQNITQPLASAASGFIGNLFGFEQGGVMTSSGPLPLKAYASGGIAASPQLALFGEGRTPEAFVPLPDGRTIPVTMKGAGTVVQINVENNAGPDTRASAQASTDDVGNTQVQILIERIEGTMSRRIGQGSGLAPVLEGRYGLNPAAGARR